MIHSNDTIKSVSELTFVNDNSDEIISQLLRKLDKVIRQSHIINMKRLRLSREQKL